MSEKCVKCFKIIERREKAVECQDCRSKAHLNCAGLPNDALPSTLEKRRNWKCGPCQRRGKGLQKEAVKFSRKKEGMVGGGDVLDKSGQVINALGQLCDHYNTTDKTKKNQVKMAIYEAKSVVEDLAQIVLTLMVEVENLKLKVADMDQHNRRNALDIAGIPYEQDEDLMLWVKKISSAISFDLKEEMIEVIYRTTKHVKKKTNEPEEECKNDLGILVFFVRRFDKEEFLRRYRLHSGVLTLKDLGVELDGSVSIIGSLTPYRIQMLCEARKFARKHDFKRIGTRNGDIYIRREEDSPIVYIKSPHDFERIEKKLSNGKKEDDPTTTDEDFEEEVNG